MKLTLKFIINAIAVSTQNAGAATDVDLAPPVPVPDSKEVKAIIEEKVDTWIAENFPFNAILIRNRLRRTDAK